MFIEFHVGLQISKNDGGFLSDLCVKMYKA